MELAPFLDRLRLIENNRDLKNLISTGKSWKLPKPIGENQ